MPSVADPRGLWQRSQIADGDGDIGARCDRAASRRSQWRNTMLTQLIIVAIGSARKDNWYMQRLAKTSGTRV
jgi:hypothetical protein